jgi:branched-chain amino acid transport system substrate-binding protein
MNSLGERKMYRILASIIIIGLVFSSSGCSTENKTGIKEIYVPVLADASWLKTDPAFVNGVTIAAEEVNTEYSNKGFLVKSAIVDDKGLYETGVEKATKLAADEKVTAVFNLQNFDVSKTTAGILSEK